MTTEEIHSARLQPSVGRPPALEPAASPVFRPALRIVVPFGPHLPFPTPPPAPAPRLDLGNPSDPDDPGPTPTPRRELPDPAAQARRLVLATLEAVAGRRPVQQLRPHLTMTAYDRVVAWSLRGFRSRVGGRYVRNFARSRIEIGRAVVCEPADGVAEVTVLVHWGGRTHAAAVRLEGRNRRWLCTVLAILE